MPNNAMPAPVPIEYETLDSALQWSSSGAPSEHQAFLSRETGELFFTSVHGNFGENPPDNIDDEALYIAVPHKIELDLGRDLAIAFIEECAPSHSRAVQGFFHHRGAYAKYKALLERLGLLEAWYKYESAATRAALERWATENGFTISSGNAA